jgi:hypothetical protein
VLLCLFGWLAAGGLYNQGNLTMTSCEVHSNIGAAYGGGITNEGNLTLIDCAVHSNRLPTHMVNRPPWMSTGEVRDNTVCGQGLRTLRTHAMRFASWRCASG